MVHDARRRAPASRSGESGTVVPEQGPGQFRAAAALDLPVPHGAFTYTVEVEENLDFTPDRVAGFVDATLTDSRSWGTDTRPLVRVNTASSARVLIATPTGGRERRREVAFEFEAHSSASTCGGTHWTDRSLDRLARSGPRCPGPGAWGR